MIRHIDTGPAILFSKLKQREIVVAGNSKLKIFGTLRCRSGMRMKRANRVFFSTKEEARSLGYRPCAHCMYSEYKNWKDGII